MRFRLQTFGGIRLTAENGEALRVQRRRLAALALRAASGEHGPSREQLIGCLSPDIPPDIPEKSAKHALTQLLCER